MTLLKKSIVVILTLLPVSALIGSCSGERGVRAALSGSQLDSLRANAGTLHARGQVEEAVRLYDQVIEARPGDIPALMGRGHCYLALKRWGDAEDDAGDILKADSANVSAHYLKAVSYREIGINQFLHIGWKTSESEFQRVVQRDSSFEDVLFQYAVLLRYKENFREAIHLAEAQLRWHPERIEHLTELSKLYRVFIASEDTALTLPWLRSRTGALPTFFTAEVLRRHGNPAAAESVFTAMLLSDTVLPAQPKLLALSKAAVMQGDGDRGELLYRRALEVPGTDAGVRFLFEDAKYVMSDAELTAYRRLPGAAEKRNFFRAFWAAKNPEPATGRNPRLLEHIRRTLVAEELHEYFGFRTYFNNPDRERRLHFPAVMALNEEFNDMGMMFLRHGKPSETLQVAPGMDNESEQSWLYEGVPGSPRLIFHFQKFNSAANNWRLTALPSNPRMVEDLQMWDSRYGVLLRPGALDRFSATERLAGESSTQVAYGLATEEQTWDKKIEVLRIPHAVDIFRAAEGKGLVDISFAIPLEPFLRRLPDTVKSLPVEVGLSLATADARDTLARLDTLVLRTPRGQNAVFVDLRRYTARPDSYIVSMHVRPLSRDMFGSWKQPFRVKDFSGPGMKLSSIQLLVPATRTTSLEIDGIKVMQSPFRGVSRRSPLYIYYQGYNLVRDDFGNTRYVSEVFLLPEKSDDPDDRISLDRREKTGREETAAEFHTLNIAKVSTGRYRLMVRFTDLRRVSTVEGFRTLEVRD